MEEKVVYSDGDIETKILNSIDDEIEFKEIYEQPGAVFHNFSKSRENLINWYPFKSNARVLEIGAGMGALTGCLCERCEYVTSIEESPRRAEIIKKRHSKYTNLEVVSHDIYTYEFEQKYDYILLIGVLEYVGINNKEGDPYKKLLGKISELLTDEGVLLLAIENKYGLKYWCGAAEDHTGVPFESINDYKMDNATGRYGKAGVRTFSKQELTNMCDEVGLRNYRFYYPMPDYKFPSSIFTDKHLPKQDDIRSIKFYYPSESELVANEKDVYQDIIDNQTFPFFSNSFLIELSKSELSKDYIEFVSHKRDYKDQYKIRTTISSGRIVEKCADIREAKEHILQSYRNIQDLRDKGIQVLPSKINEKGDMVIDYCDKSLAIDEFNYAISVGDVAKLEYMLQCLEGALKKSTTLHKGSPSYIVVDEDEEVLDVAYLDMTFINSFFDGQELIFFDQEWNVENIPIKYVLYRAVKYSKAENTQAHKIKAEIIRNIGISPEKKALYDEFEREMLLKMMDEVSCNIFDPMGYHEGLTIYPQSRKVVAGLYEQLDEKEEEIRKARNEINEKEEEIRKREVVINNQRGHIEQLLEVDRHYQNIIRSKGWRLVSFPGRVFEKLFPIGTPRRNRISMVNKYVHALNWTNVKFVCAAFAHGGMKQVRKEFHAFEVRTGEVLPQEKPDIVEVEEIKTIEECQKLVFKKYDNPDVSIVIPVYNQFTYTYHCLESILKNSGDVSYEILIADDVSNDLTTRLSEVAENVQIIRNIENQRFLRNCNHAAQYAKGKYILFLNNDTQVQENWLQPLVDLIERDEKIGMVGSKLIYPDGTLQEAGGIIWGDGHAWNYGNGQNPANPEFNYVKEVDYISGAAIMIRASLWKEIGGFDEFFAPAYCEDSDLAFEVRKHGYKLMYQPLSVVVHFEGKSNGTDTSTGVKAYQVENSKKLAQKWNEEFKKQSQSEFELFRARERSQNKKTILVIDHYVPQFDKDAGSKTTWQYLKMFVKMGYNVKFMGENFYQDEPYTTALQQIGIEVLYGPWYANNYEQWILDNQEYIDFVYLNRPHITEKYIDFLRENTSIKLIYYGHDLHFLRLQREYELNGDEQALKESQEWKKKEFEIMRKAAINYYPSYVEVDEIHKIDADIPAKAITAYVYEDFLEDIDVNFADKKGILFVGGFGHPPNADAVNWFVKDVYPKIREQEDIPFYIVGSMAPPEITKLNGKNGIVVKGFVSEEELTELYNTCKLVVVPLRYGAGVKGKVVEALYNGTPMVSTTVGIEGIQGAEQFMEVADDAQGFADKVVALYRDNDKLRTTVKNYQNYVKEHNSIEAVWNIVKEDFQ